MNEDNNIQQPGIQDSGNQSSINRKKIRVIFLLNIILLVGLVVIYVLYFFDKKEDTGVDRVEKQEIERKISDESINIGFIDSDELIERYDFAEQLREEMRAEQRRLESDITRRQQEFQREVEEFQRQMQQGQIPMDQAQVKEQDLMQKQQELMALSEQYTERLRSKEMEYNVELYDSISSFIERYNEEFGYDFVLERSAGGGVLFAGEQYDITEDFIERINKERDDN